MNPASTSNNSRGKIYIIGAVVLLIIVIVITFIIQRHQTTKTTPAPAKPSSGYNTNGVPTSALSVVTKYVEAREDSVGADQSSPTSWIANVQTITTPQWYSQLQPSSSSTSSVDNEYNLAHSNGYVVEANVTGCIWDDEAQQHTSTSGVINCGLSDTTLNQATKQPVLVTTLPFAWVHTGQQTPATIWVVYENGTWLVSNDTSGQGQ